MRPPQGGRLEHDGDGSVSRSVWNRPEFAGEVDGAVFLDGSGVMKREDQIQRSFFRDGFEISAPLLDGFLPAFVRDFSSFRVDMVLVVVGDLRRKNLVGESERGDVRSFAKVRDSALEIIEFFLDLSLRLGLNFPGELERDPEGIQSPGVLGVRFRPGIEDRVVIGVISQRTAVSLQSGSQHAEMMPGRVPGNQKPAHHLPGMIVDGGDHHIASDTCPFK